jgi:hypothetical protein
MLLGMRITRLSGNPIIHPGLDESVGTNINGPSLIEAPLWLPGRLARYYLYFGHHAGKFIRLAVADELPGPWRIVPGGALGLEKSFCAGHIASPDVHVDEKNKRLVMYYHGPPVIQDKGRAAEICAGTGLPNIQITRVALSKDGVNFQVNSEMIAPSYFRMFEHDGWFYGVAMPMVFFRSRDGISGWERGPMLMDAKVRHCAVLKQGERLEMFFSRREDCPERILRVTMELRGDWMDWKVGEVKEVLSPEMEWEGADLPLEASRSGAAHAPVRQLRDPGIFVAGDGAVYLLYSVAGESGIAIAKVGEGSGV